MKKIESGRSMIEMLGVLAIIGVLSIGGLAGYTMAMNRYRANNILDYVSRCAVLAQTRGMGDETSATTCADLMPGETAPSGVAGAVSRESATAPIVIAVTNVPSDAIAAALAGRTSALVTISGATTAGTTFTFNNN